MTRNRGSVILCAAKDLWLSSADGVNTATYVRFDIPIRRSFGFTPSSLTSSLPPQAGHPELETIRTLKRKLQGDTHRWGVPERNCARIRLMQIKQLP